MNPDESTYPTVRGFYDVTGRCVKTPCHNRRLSIGIVGQSLWCSTLPASLGGAPYTSKFPDNVFCGNPYDGLIYEARDPWLGCSNSWAGDCNAGVQSFMGMMGDALYMKLGFPPDLDIIIWNVSIAGSAASEWDVGGVLFPRVQWLLTRASAACAPIDIMICGQVGTECGYHATYGSGGPTPDKGNPALWRAHWQNIIGSTRPMGYLKKWLLPVYECYSTGDCVDTVFQAGILPIITYPGLQLPSGNLDLIGINGRVAPGNNHLNYGGNLAAGSLAANAVWAALGPP